MDDNGTLLSKFDYDSFGNIINQTGTIISNFRYKGYYYDTDIELYYLKSRFYNPVLLRFITPDSIEYLDSSSIIGLNLYAYCGNDPINRVDENGNWWILAFIIAVAVVATINDVCKLVAGKVKATSTGGNVQIVNSSEIHTPWVRLGYSFYLNHINPDTRDVIQGTSFGMEFEWFAHNVAYTGLSILEYVGVDSVFGKTVESLKNEAQTVDFGPTIYNDTHDWFSFEMERAYTASNPLFALIDFWIWGFCY
ncbi:RHS repeat-associated core domain-containing protein [Anaeroplasma bactoclasticum]|jgi:RHS repeat-associated protein|nr:RHS repeat-associated core domain-containing protein [Anaeroplasma bactoclasticum]